LNREVLNWLGSKILTRQGTRVLTARTEDVQTDAHYSSRDKTTRNDYNQEKRVPVKYLPTFGTTWFIHESNVFLVRRISPATVFSASTPQEYNSAPEGMRALNFVDIEVFIWMFNPVHY
jgi:chaperone BCS1